MKTLRLILALFVMALAITSCQKDFSFEAGNAKGSLGKTTVGDCDPIFVNGLYYIDTTMKATNFVDVQVDFSKIGTYTIKTDTINGYSFATTGSTGTLGLNTIRLFAKGKPIAPGFNIFTVKFDGTQCAFNVGVIVGTGGGGGGTGAAVFSFGGAPATCTGATLGGTYTSGVAMTAANNVTIPVTVTTVGTYTVTTSANGVTFSGSGTFTTTGAGSLVLTAAGTPPTSATAVNTTYPIASGTSNCSFGVAYAATPAGGPAVFTLTCSSGGTASINGTFQVGTSTNASNYIDFPINVTTAGTYTLTTNTDNGVFFSNTGFLALGTTTVRLLASGTPTTAGAPFTNFTVNTTTPVSTCSIQVPFTDGTLSFVNGTTTLNFNFANGADTSITVNPPLPNTYDLDFGGGSTASTIADLFTVSITKFTPYTTGTIDLNSFATGVILTVSYTNSAGVTYNTESAIPAPNPGFSVTISSITTNRIQGTFSGTLRAVAPATGTYTITSGNFNLPLQ